MRDRATAAILLAALTALVAVAGASAKRDRGDRHAGKGDAVFVQTNEVAGNRIVVYDRGEDGRLTPAGTYATGGTGGVALPGTESDRLASQGSLVYDPKH